MACAYDPQTDSHLTVDPTSLTARVGLYKTTRQIVPFVEPVCPQELWRGAVRMQLELSSADSGIKWGIWNPNPGRTVRVHRIQIHFSSRDPGPFALDMQWALRKRIGITSFEGSLGGSPTSDGGNIRASVFKGNVAPAFKAVTDDTIGGAVLTGTDLNIFQTIYGFRPCSDLTPSATVQGAAGQHRLWWSNPVELEAQECLTLEITSTSGEPNWRYDGSAFITEVIT